MAFDLNGFLSISWDEYFRLVNKLADEIIKSNKRYDRIVGITRAGLTLGHFLSDVLSLPISVFTIKSYSDIEKQETVEITEKLIADIKAKDILLVDELADTGKTFKKAIEYLQKKKPKSITTGAVFYKPHSIYKPDFYVETTDKWVLLPYEFTENAILLKKMLDGENREVESNLLKLGYKKNDLKLLKSRGII